MLSGDNGILQRATDAKTKSDEAQIRERIQLAYHSALTKDITGENGELTVETLQGELNNEFAGKTVTIKPSADKKEWTIKVDNVEETVLAGKDEDEDQDQMTVAKAKSEEKVFDEDNTPIIDDYGNEIIIPKGFKVSNDSTDSVTGGVVIEDATYTNTIGSQFVWIPVGTIYTNKSKTEYKTITLDRYFFITDNGTKTSEPTSFSDVDDVINSNRTYQKSLYREEEKNATLVGTNGNYIAKDIYSSNGFIKSVQDNGGFFIGRYEARKDSSGNLTENGNDNVYNNVTQLVSAEKSRAMYSDINNFESDLINSYAWDTTLIFLQTFEKDDYSTKPSINTSDDGIASQGTNKLSANKQDILCKIYDISSKCYEWTTESSSYNGTPCVYRGGAYNSGTAYAGDHNMAAPTNASGATISFRPIIYLK